MYYKRRGEAIATGSRKSVAGSVFDRCRGFLLGQRERREREMKRDERERERGRRPSGKHREDGEFAHADGIRKLALENYEDHDNADDEVNDGDDPVREE